MKLSLPTPPRAYDAQDQSNTRRAIQTALEAAEGRFEDLLIIRGRRIYLEDETTGQVRQLGLAGGVLILKDPI